MHSVTQKFFLDANNIVENILTSKLNNDLAISNMCAAGDTETNWNSIFKEISFRKARTYFMTNLHKCMQVLFHLFMLYCIVYCIIILWRSHVKRILKGTALRDGSGCGSFNRSKLKSFAKIGPSLYCESPFKTQRHLVLYRNWLLVSYCPTVHTAPVGFLLHRTMIGKCAIKKLGIDSQWWRELFLIIIFHFSIGKPARMLR